MHRKTFLAFLFLFFCLCSLSLAATPNITGIAPDTRKQNWYGKITIRGSNFESGASFEVSAPDSFVYSTSRESSATLEAWIYISSFEAVGTKNITVRNPGGETHTPANIFLTVVAPAAAPVFSKIYFEGKAYEEPAASVPLLIFAVTPSTEVMPSTLVSVEATGTVSMTAGVAKLKINVSGTETEFTNLIQVNSQIVSASMELALPAASTPTITLIAEDDHGNRGTKACLVAVLRPTSSLPSQRTLRVGAPHRSFIDPVIKKEPFGFTLRLEDEKVYIEDGFWVVVKQGVGGKVLCRRFFAGAYSVNTNFSVPAEDLAVAGCSRGIATAYIIDNVSGRVIGKMNFAIWTQ